MKSLLWFVVLVCLGLLVPASASAQCDWDYDVDKFTGEKSLSLRVLVRRGIDLYFEPSGDAAKVRAKFWWKGPIEQSFDGTFTLRLADGDLVVWSPTEPKPGVVRAYASGGQYSATVTYTTSFESEFPATREQMEQMAAAGEVTDVRISFLGTDYDTTLTQEERRASYSHAAACILSALDGTEEPAKPAAMASKAEKKARERAAKKAAKKAGRKKK